MLTVTNGSCVRFETVNAPPAVDTAARWPSISAPPLPSVKMASEKKRQRMPRPERHHEEKARTRFARIPLLPITMKSTCTARSLGLPSLRGSTCLGSTSCGAALSAAHSRRLPQSAQSVPRAHAGCPELSSSPSQPSWHLPSAARPHTLVHTVRQSITSSKRHLWFSYK